MDVDIKAKQQFLREKIIDQGYDPVPFTEFLSQQRDNGHDIETWSMADLQDVVNKYIAVAPRPEAAVVAADQYASEADESHEEDEKSSKLQKAPQQEASSEAKEKSPVEKSAVSTPLSILR